MQESEPETELISKNVAAIEVINRLQKIKILSIMGIGLIFLLVLFNNLILIGGLGLVGFGFFLVNAIKEEKNLKEKYGV